MIAPEIDARAARRALIEDRLHRRSTAGEAYFAAAATPIARCALAMAAAFAEGATLFVLGDGPSLTDAQHAAVEFVHPALPGCRTLPAVALGADAPTATALRLGADPDSVHERPLETLSRPGDILLVLGPAPAPVAVERCLRSAARRGLLSVAVLAGAAGGEATTVADHLLVVPTGDPLVGQELQLATYHILWELIHVALNHRGIPTPAEAR